MSSVRDERGWQAINTDGAAEAPRCSVGQPPVEPGTPGTPSWARRGRRRGGRVGGRSAAAEGGSRDCSLFIQQPRPNTSRGRPCRSGATPTPHHRAPAGPPPAACFCGTAICAALDCVLMRSHANATGGAFVQRRRRRRRRPGRDEARRPPARHVVGAAGEVQPSRGARRGGWSVPARSKASHPCRSFGPFRVVWRRIPCPDRPIRTSLQWMRRGRRRPPPAANCYASTPRRHAADSAPPANDTGPFAR
jgi:hypothetical protein